jgi:cation transporter-like permease
MPESFAFKAFLMGIISASSLLIGGATSFFWKPADKTVAFLMAGGGGALLAALTIDLMGEALHRWHYMALCCGALIGGLLFIALDYIINNYGGFLRKAEEDLKRMSGVAIDAKPEDSVLRMVRGRIIWLVIAMIGSVLGALIIMQFEEALEKAAILAAFIPLVAATAGNAGIQSSALAVQGLARGSVWGGGILRRLVKEFAVALLNGLGIAVLVSMFIFTITLISPEELEQPLKLALTIGTALMGVVMPLILNRIGIDLSCPRVRLLPSATM